MRKRVLSDRENCMRADNLKKDLRGSILDNIKLTFSAPSTPAVQKGISFKKDRTLHTYMPELVKVGKFRCMKFIGGQVQLIYKHSLWNVEFFDQNNHLMARLSNGLVLR